MHQKGGLRAPFLLFVGWVAICIGRRDVRQRRYSDLQPTPDS